MITDSLAGASGSVADRDAQPETNNPAPAG